MFYTEYSISEAATSDSGTYTCSVTNPIGSDSHSVTVNVGKGVIVVHSAIILLLSSAVVFL